jgi:dTDP-glucose pyrophosphorylase
MKELGRTLEKDSVKVTYYNVEDPDGLAEAVLRDVMTTPAMIVTDDNDKEIASWHNRVPSKEDVKLKLK